MIIYLNQMFSLPDTLKYISLPFPIRNKLLIPVSRISITDTAMILYTSLEEGLFVNTISIQPLQNSQSLNSDIKYLQQRTGCTKLD